MSERGGATTHHDEYQCQDPQQQIVQSAFFRIVFSSL
jgi:hypothetical protein